jgi:hypothetical protein
VRRKIRYVPGNIVPDLSEPGLGCPDGLDILQHHYRQGARRDLGISKANPAFVCLTHEGGTNPGLFLQKRGGRWWAIHYESGECSSCRLPAPMSDEHKRQTEYWARAAQDAGWRVELEHALATGTRPDALIHGPVMTSIEAVVGDDRLARGRPDREGCQCGRHRRLVQRSVRAPEVGLAGADGTAPGAGHRRRPGRLHNVADAAAPARRRRRRASRAADAQVHAGELRPLPVRPQLVRPLPPAAGPVGGLTVDDVAARLPAGELRPLRFWGITMLAGSRHRDAVFLVSPADFDLYEELTGWPGSVSFEPGDEDRPPREPSGAVDCRNGQPARQLESRGIRGIDPQTRMYCDSCGSMHPIIEHRACRAAGN